MNPMPFPSPGARHHATTADVRRMLAFGIAVAAALLSARASAATSCSAHSASRVLPVVELYTSEGCNSCPPADRWLSRLKTDAPVVALAFHVDYWDRLGWKDRFASPVFTQRQSAQQRSSGARFSYTPQVIVDGADRSDWASAVVGGTRPPAPVDVQLMRDAEHLHATVKALANAPPRLAAYWAITEDGHVSAVQAGENQGATLHHDHVVRDYRPVAAWAARPDAPAQLDFDAATPADPAHPREVNLVILNADTGRPVQAVKLGC
jgi:hypothetical protein